MKNSLEQFIRDHRDEFDNEEPSRKIWDEVQHQHQPEPASAPVTRVIRLQYIKWAVAAVLLILVGSGTTWLLMRNHSSTGSVARVQQPIKEQDTQATVVVPSEPNSNQTNENAKPDSQQKNEQAVVDQESTIKEEMFHFARLVEIKHQELKKIEKDEPLLYKQFASDVNKLDSVYHILEKQLPANPNHKQLLEAMKQNLQLQMDLLNHQLEIIKQINHSKKSAYENAYKTI